MKAPLSFEGACDCHIHVYEQGYPLAPSATFIPPPAPASAYAQVQRTLGLSRAIVVQPTGYGFDNRCTLAAIAKLGHGARGIAVVPSDVGDDELQRLHDAGIRGVRFMMLAGGVLPWDVLAEMSARIAPLGWNINLQLDGHTLPQHEAMLSRLGSKLVIDHLGKFLAPVTPQSEGFASLCRLLDGGRCWIKLSAPYESSGVGGPAFDDVAWLVSKLSSRYPERGLWASNWPHPNVRPLPDDAHMLDWTMHLVEGDDARRKILVDNPADLYQFQAG
ncbi:amidohydrolase family protein [Caballeronia grimmiae]|uniref:2-pyrone-4,6-dicarboxylate hydrolase n=1 Tax=Caballeronia grimmiae TaxID=1071679 RepID=A0A069P778_9BURK|nr:amidohydrolase family protein [Caballeronia grimmiae]KDR35729.1 amidohydrolase [Caballeronia grimmiae]GGD83593.1 2-pyrone-4,6-dicarboxylate hydrolase [Caballeronia grimmiae]